MILKIKGELKLLSGTVAVNATLILHSYLLIVEGRG